MVFSGKHSSYFFLEVTVKHVIGAIRTSTINYFGPINENEILNASKSSWVNVLIVLYTGGN